VAGRGVLTTRSITVTCWSPPPCSARPPTGSTRADLPTAARQHCPDPHSGTQSACAHSWGVLRRAARLQDPDPRPTQTVVPVDAFPATGVHARCCDGSPARRALPAVPRRWPTHNQRRRTTPPASSYEGAPPFPSWSASAARSVDAGSRSQSRPAREPHNAAGTPQRITHRPCGSSRDNLGRHHQPGVVIDAGHHLDLCPVAQMNPAHDIHLPSRYRPTPPPAPVIAAPPTTLGRINTPVTD